MVAPTTPPFPAAVAGPTIEFIEAFNTHLLEAKLEALNFLQSILTLDTDKDLVLRTQQRLAATAILHTKELKLPKPPREPRTKRPLSHFTGEDRPRRQPRSGESGLHTPTSIPRSLKNMEPEALIALAHQAFAPDSGFRPMDQIRIAERCLLEHIRHERAEINAQRAQARASRRKPDT